MGCLCGKKVVFQPHESTVWPQPACAAAAPGRRGGNTE